MTAPGLAACLVLMAVSLAACQSADSGTGDRMRTSRLSGNKTAQGRQNQDNHAAKEENARDTGTTRGQEAVPESSDMEAGQERAAAEQGEDGLMTADQWQMVPGYGICKRGEPVLYVLDMDASQMKTDEKGVSARLLSAVFQDNVISVRVKFKDDTVTLIPDEKVKEILKQEEDNRKNRIRELAYNGMTVISVLTAKSTFTAAVRFRTESGRRRKSRRRRAQGPLPLIGLRERV